MTHTYPFRDPLCDYMHRAVVSRIQSPDWIFELPDLTDDSWELICNNARERERLEFLGDALIGASLSEELFRIRPNEGPGFYTIARTVLTANSTFAHIMHKVGFHDINAPVKPAGDAFETILAAFHSERGPGAFQAYVREYFVLLIDSVGRAYDQCRLNTKLFRRKKHQILAVKSHLLAHVRERKKYKKNTMKKAQSRMSLQLPVRSTPMRPVVNILTKREEAPARRPIVIDLTAEDDSEDEVQEALTGPFNRGQRSSPRFETPRKSLSVKNPVSEQCTPRSSNNGVSENIESWNILQCISISPQVVSARERTNIISPRSRLPSAVLKTAIARPSRADRDIQDDLITRFNQASLSGSGSIDNPITID